MPEKAGGQGRRRGGVVVDLARDTERFCGLSIVHRSAGSLVGEIEFLRTCEEIYDVQVLPRRRRPGILGVADETHRRALSLPEQTFWGAERSSAPKLAPTVGEPTVR